MEFGYEQSFRTEPGACASREGSAEHGHDLFTDCTASHELRVPNSHRAHATLRGLSSLGENRGGVQSLQCEQVRPQFHCSVLAPTGSE